MEYSKTQNKVLNLGKTIVKELELDPGVDTLSKWMAHYVAEMIFLAENLSGEKKAKAEEQCVDIILKIWDRRWSIPKNNPFLQDFKSLFETLEKLKPNNEKPFFLSTKFFFEIEEEINKSESNPNENKFELLENGNWYPKNYLNATIRVDKIARSLITDLLKKSISGIKLSEERGNLIRNSINAIDYPESQIISTFSDYSMSLESTNESGSETQNRIIELKSKIKELQELESFLKALTSIYCKELLELEK
jgi:hypothetical protein